MGSPHTLSQKATNRAIRPRVTTPSTTSTISHVVGSIDRSLQGELEEAWAVPWNGIVAEASSGKTLTARKWEQVSRPGRASCTGPGCKPHDDGPASGLQ